MLACIKLNKEDYIKILNLYQEEDKKVLVNFIALGITYDKHISKSTKNIERPAMDLARQLL